MVKYLVKVLSPYVHQVICLFLVEYVFSLASATVFNENKNSRYFLCKGAIL